MLKVPIVEDCPHTNITGQMVMPHYIIAALAGAVQDKEEWMSFLKGKRSEDGLTVWVTHFKVPDHYRSGGNVQLMRHEPLGADIVGVVHSHHTFGAFFSGTDKEELNTRFPTSIVVAQPKRSSNDEHYSLGFEYEAVGKVTLPCGSMGHIKFFVVPTPLPPNWIEREKGNFDKPDTESLGDCNNLTTRKHKTHEEIKTKCDLVFHRALPSIFGTKDNLIMPQVEKRGKSFPVQKHWQWDGMTRRGEDRGWLKSWSDVSDRKDRTYQPRSDQWGWYDEAGNYHFHYDI